MINREHELSLVKQCRVLDIARSGIYYELKPVRDDDLRLMRLMDEIHLSKPYLGVRRIKGALQDLGHTVNRKRVQRLMRQMGICAIYPKAHLSKTNTQHKIYPYLLRNLDINRPNQVWASDVTYIPMAKGFAYLTVIMDWYSRKILSWRLSNSLDASFCVDALEEAIYRFGAPEVFNSDQGSQYTSDAFTAVLKANDIRISMDGKGAWRDNVFVERLWRSVKYEQVYLNAYESMDHARQRLNRWIEFYNTQRRHQTLNCTPDQKYGRVQTLKKVA
jgi:putative transposase